MKRTSPLALSLSLVCLACSSRIRTVASSASAPAQLSFGDVQVGGGRTLSITVTNDALYSFDLVSVQVAAPFSVATGPLTIPASSAVTFQVVFAPQAAQAFDQPLIINLSATDTPSLTVKLTGAGVAAPACGASACGAGQACCGDACIDTQSDPAHCGGCSPCAAFDSCVKGACQAPAPAGCSAATCGAGHACCGDACIDTQSDPAHCGGCSPCVAGQACVNGGCVAPAAFACDDLTAPCPGGEKCCNHACVVTGPAGLCPCSPGTGTTTFGAGSIIIPMDACYQRGADVSTPPAYCDRNAKTVADDSPLKAYGLVFFLLRHQVTVYMAINPAKTAPDSVDLSLAGFVSRSAPVLRYDWATGKGVSLADPSATQVAYRGGPFLIDSSQHDRVLQLLATDPDFAQFRARGTITLHIANLAFRTAVAKTINVVPSRVALLVSPDDRSPVDILIRYLASAGLDFPGAGGTPGAHGQIYDQLQEADFLPDYEHSNLKAGGYRLLWAPHWTGASARAQEQLTSIGGFVNAGGDLFAECAAIGTLEGFIGGNGSAAGSGATRFMTTSGMAGNDLNLSRNDFTGPFSYGGLTSPFAQHGDFPFVGFYGAITDFHPDFNSSSRYDSGVTRLITARAADTDLFTTVDLHAQGKGTVVYLAGHDYSYGGDNDGKSGTTAGSRLVLNTLFSLGTNDLCQP